jgi:hypothetical protein
VEATCGLCGRTISPESRLSHGDIRLADVLLAIETLDDEPAFGLSVQGELIMATEENAIGWNLRRDSLDEQADEGIEFLHSLLHA